MAFSNIDNQQLGKFLQIAFAEGIRNQISNDYRDWEYIQRERVSDPQGRELRWFIQKSLGPSAVQYRNPNFTAAFPSAQQISTQELTAVFKEIDATIEIEYNMWKRAQKSGNVRYAEPLMVEIESKLTATKRQLSKDLYGDGTGVLGQLLASSAVESGNVRFQLSTANTARGHVGFFEFDEICVLKTNAGGTSGFDSDLGTEPAYWKVVSRRRLDNTVLMQPLDSSLAALSISSISTDVTAGDVFYKYEQPTFPDLSSISDYATVTEVIAGLESLTADDGRTVHGNTHSGSTGGTRFDASAVQIDVSHIEAVMNDLKIAVGEGAYRWPMACMAPETRSVFIETRESDRRFNSWEDSKRGVRVFGYQHEDDSIEFKSSEYCPKTRIYMMPEAKASQGRVLEYHGTDFEPVQTEGGDKFHLKPASTGGYERRIQTFLEGYGVLINKHPAACGVIDNFIIS